MNRKKKKKSGYARLRTKIFFQSLSMIGLAVVVIFWLYSTYLYGRFANWVVDIFQRVLSLGYDDALRLYQGAIRNNIEKIMMAGIIICFLLMFWFFLSWFTKYFKEIDDGIDALAERGQDTISMSKEMAPMEDKLNEVKQTLKAQFEEIQAAEQKKDELVMYLAHDIRTPLTSVIGYLNLMEEMPNLSEEQREKFIHVTLDKANRLEVLINEFFDIVRYNKQGVELQKREIDLYFMLVQMVEEAYPQLEEQGKHADIQADEELMVYADVDKLARIFLNILKNAILYSEINSTIMIEARREGSNTLVKFTNRGKTISEAEQKRLFDKFYRMDTARQTNTGGAGLGLAIARDLAALHGGDITVMSDNGTTTFTVLIPNK